MYQQKKTKVHDLLKKIIHSCEEEILINNFCKDLDYNSILNFLVIESGASKKQAEDILSTYIQEGLLVEKRVLYLGAKREKEIDKLKSKVQAELDNETKKEIQP